MRGTYWLGAAVVALSLAGMAATAAAQTKTVTINKIDANGVGEAVGTLALRDTPQGLFIEPKLNGLPPGAHGFHIHQNPNCGPGPGANTQPAPGMAAGGHYDPRNAGKHRGPHTDDSHLGDLPVLVVEANGSATLPVVAKRLKMRDVTGRAIMIHAGGDNFDDQPQPLGGGAGRIACGVIR